MSEPGLAQAPAESPPRAVSPGQRKSYRTACVIDLTAAVLWLMVSSLAMAAMPTGGKFGVEILAGVLGLGLPPLLGWFLFHATKVDMRIVLAVVWAPIVLVVIGIPVAIAITG